MPSWKAGVNVSDAHQEIVVSLDGAWFKNNGVMQHLSGNRALILHALCKYAGKGQDNSATYTQLISHVWGDDEDRDSSFDSLKQNLVAGICNIKDSGLREAISNHRGHGYYWCPQVLITFSGMKTPGEVLKRPPTILERRYALAEEEADIQLRESRRALSKSLVGKLGKSDAPALLASFAQNGFTDADLARIFNITRPTAAAWRKRYR